MQTVGGIYFPPLELIGEHPPCRTGTDKSNEISVTTAPLMNVVATGSGGEKNVNSPPRTPNFNVESVRAAAAVVS